MPSVQNESPLKRVAPTQAIHIAVSPFHIKDAGSSVLIYGLLHGEQSLGTQIPGSEAPITTQTVTEELRAMGFNIMKVGAGLITPKMMDKLDYIFNGTISPVHIATYGHFAGQHTEVLCVLNLEVLDAQTGDTLWESSADGQAAVENDPPVYLNRVNTRSAIQENFVRATKIAIQNAFRKTMRDHAPELLDVLQKKAITDKTAPVQP
jgi:hypothetical protein